MDLNNTGVITQYEFISYFQKVTAHWSSLINNHVRVDKEELVRIFNVIDYVKDGEIDFREYSYTVDKSPELIDWYALLNPKISDTKDKNADLERQTEERK